MAKFPGSSYRFGTDFRTGEPQMWQQTARLASTVGEVVGDIWIRQAYDQFSTYKIELKRLEGEMATELTKTQDETKYDSILEKYRGMARSASPKNPLAVNMSSKYYEDKNVEWKEDIKAAKYDRLKDKWMIKRDVKERDAEKTGILTDYITEEFIGVAFGYTDESQARERVQKATHNAQKGIVERIATSSKPELFLGKYKTYQDLVKDYPALTPGDFQDLRSTAVGQKSFLSRQEDIATSAIYDDVLRHAAEGTTPDEMRRLLKDTVGITEVERTNLMKAYMSAQSIWQDKGIDPWKSTQDYNALMSMQLRISAGVPTTEMDIWGAMLSEPSKGPLFSRSDALNLIGQLPDKSTEAIRSPLGKQWIADIDDMFMDDGNLVPVNKREAWWNVRSEGISIINKTYPDAGKMNKEMTDFLKPAKKEKTKSLLSRLLTIGSPLGLAEEITGLGGLTSPAKMLFRGLPKTKPIHVDTLEEAEKLKQGQKFEYLGKVYTRK